MIPRGLYIKKMMSTPKTRASPQRIKSDSIKNRNIASNPLKRKLPYTAPLGSESPPMMTAIKALNIGVYLLWERPILAQRSRSPRLFDHLDKITSHAGQSKDFLHAHLSKRPDNFTCVPARTEIPGIWNDYGRHY
jgi:hypothetical protein